MLNGIQKKGLNENADMNIKIWKFPGASLTDILDNIKPSLRREPDQILIHAKTNDQTNKHNYLNNVKKSEKMDLRKTCRNIKLCFSPLIFWTDLKDIRVQINLLHHEKLYDRNLLILASSEGTLWLSLMGWKFCNFACCRLLENVILNVN